MFLVEGEASGSEDNSSKEQTGLEPDRIAPVHLNSTGCYIKYTPGKGRGVFASDDLPRSKVVEISPVLLFSSQEYEEHGRHTVLDHYTFKWRDGRLALALGLGSLFNHSQRPNVSYILDPTTESISYTTSRPVKKDEELCIFYGYKLWFEPAEQETVGCEAEDQDDGWGGLSSIQDPEDAFSSPESWALLQGDEDEVVANHELPFERLKLIDDEAEDEVDAVKTESAWVVDIPNPRHTTTMLKWLKQSGLETEHFAHLKRIRKKDGVATLLLAPSANSPSAPQFPDDFEGPAAYQVVVPKSAALTQKSLAAKLTFWPTVYTPRKKGELEPISRGRLRWIWEAMRVVRDAAVSAQATSDLPIAAYVPIPYGEEARAATQFGTALLAHDTRRTASHPLRHAVLNLVRKVADYRAKPTEPCSTSHAVDVDTDPGRNGSHYLLTSLTVFLSHEPCIMCSMALLHSRVKEVFYLVPMEKTGGCGSVACLPRLDGVNHRFTIARWKSGEGGISVEGLRIPEEIDA